MSGDRGYYSQKCLTAAFTATPSKDDAVEHFFLSSKVANLENARLLIKQVKQTILFGFTGTTSIWTFNGQGECSQEAILFKLLFYNYYKGLRFVLTTVIEVPPLPPRRRPV